jgi:hypothetical protein
VQSRFSYLEKFKDIEIDKKELAFILASFTFPKKVLKTFVILPSSIDC